MKLNPRLIREARHSQAALVLSLALGLMGGIAGIFQARGIAIVISQVFLDKKPLAAVSYLLVIILFIILLRICFSWGSEYVASQAASRIKQGLRVRFLAHLYDLGPAFLRRVNHEIRPQTGDLVNLTTEGIDALEIYFSQYLPQIALAALIPLSILFFVFPSDPLSGLIFLFTAPLLPIFMILISNTSEALTRKQWLGLSRMSAYFMDVLQGLPTLKSLGRSRDQVDVINKVSENYRQTTMGVLKVTFLSALVLELIASLSTAVVAVEVGIRLLYGRMAFEQAFFILLLAPEFYLPLRLLGSRFHAGMAGAEAGRRIFDILDQPIPDKALLANKLEQHPHELYSPPTITFKNVSYAYPNEPFALDRITFKIPPRKMTVLVGESGAGKTTLTWLLLRFLEPRSGTISVDGKSLSEIPSYEWYKLLAWVPQNPYLFNDTIAANIRLAKPEADEMALQRAAHLAHADEFIQQLPQGYETPIGERGVRLSAGQAQRIALARAFLKDAPLLILDEVTSHLDPEIDSHLQSSVELLSSGRTVLAIAHCRATLAKADQVIKLSHGRLERLPRVQPSRKTLQTKNHTNLPVTEQPPHPQIITTPGEPQQVQVESNLQQPIKRRVSEIISPYIGRIFLSILLGFLTIMSSVGLMATASYIISAAALHPSIVELQIAIVGVRFFGLSRGVFRYLERLVSHDVTFRLLARWRVWFYQAVEPLAPSRLMHYHSGDLLTRVIRDIASLESFYVRTIAPPFIAVFVSIASVILIGGFGDYLAFILLGLLILAGIGLPFLALAQSRQLGPRIIQARAHLSTLLVDAIQGMPDLFSSGQADQQLERLDRAGEKLAKLQARVAGLSAMNASIMNLIAYLAMLLVLVMAIQRITQGQLDAVFLGVVALIAFTCFEAMQPLPQVALNFEANRAALHRLDELVESPSPVLDPKKPVQIPAELNLDVKGLSFQYPPWIDTPSPVERSSFRLEDISFSLPYGKHIALIGPSGAGKTTLTSLLLRFWDYQYGSIRLGNNELRHYCQDDIRNRIAVVSQNTYLFTATIRDNLLIARPQASNDEIIQAAKQAQLDDFIQTLPAGYDTWIGEHGLRLSAGERQRLAIARALLKDSPLLILDEPTANLDPATELAVIEAIRLLGRNRSTITITPRMVGLEAMDEILVLQNGHIIERGSHDQLLALRGFYYRMWGVYQQIL